MWPDLAKFRHFGNKIKVSGKSVWIVLVFGKFVNLLWQIFNAFGQFFTVVDGQILNKKSSHLVTLLTLLNKPFHFCRRPRWRRSSARGSSSGGRRRRSRSQRIEPGKRWKQSASFWVRSWPAGPPTTSSPSSPASAPRASTFTSTCSPTLSAISTAPSIPSATRPPTSSSWTRSRGSWEEI